MKVNKAFLELGGKRLIQYVLDVITPLFSSVLINSNSPEVYQEWGLPVIPDVWPDKGALGGIYTALKHTVTSHVFCVACDMPFLNPILIQAMIDRAHTCDILIPRAPDGHHPLHAIYATRCAAHIEPLLHANQLKISNLFPLVDTRYMEQDEIREYDPHYRSFLNVNTWDDVNTARERFNFTSQSTIVT